MKKIGVIGAGGLGRETMMVIEHINKKQKLYDIIGFFDDDKNIHGQLLNGHKVVGGLDWIINNYQKDYYYVIGIGSPASKKKIVEELEKYLIKFETVVHPSVIINENVKIGNGTVITSNCILTVNITIGNHVFLNLASTIGHDAIIKDYCNINPICAINGNNFLGEGVTLGTGAKLIHNVTIGDWATVGAGSVVIGNIPEYSTAVGVPARVIKIRGERV
jgi:sugar O-acyltransferase (sialic acid O-acetyltransferase NeuD family)